jgi:dihydrofolate synthase/folylpolyglutamate synthase
MRAFRRGSERIDVLVDGAHSPAGARALAAYLDEAYAGRRLPMIFGAMDDKDLHGLLSALLPCASAVVCTAPHTRRAAAPDRLAAMARGLAPALDVRTAATPADALAIAASLGEPIIAAGSLYLAGEIRDLLS